MRSLYSSSLALMLLACRPPLGEPSYPDISADSGNIDDGSLPGDSPWDGVSPRLSFGLFYEGGATEEFVVDNATINYFIYDGTYTQAPDAEDFVEGFSSDRLLIAGAGYIGGGVNFENGPPVDLSSWTTLHIAMKSANPALESLQIRFKGLDGGGTVITGAANIVDHGFVADDQWYVLNIPLSAMVPAVPLDQIVIAPEFFSPTAEGDTSILIDDMYLTAEEAR